MALLDLSLVTRAFTELIARQVELSPVWQPRPRPTVSPLAPDLLPGAGLSFYLYHVIEKAHGKLRDQPTTVAASDAYFPVPDGPKLLIEAGIGCIVHPGGSRRDQQTNDLCDEHGVTCLLTGVRHFRH